VAKIERTADTMTVQAWTDGYPPYFTVTSSDRVGPGFLRLPRRENRFASGCFFTRRFSRSTEIPKADAASFGLTGGVISSPRYTQRLRSFLYADRGGHLGVAGCIDSNQ